MGNTVFKDRALTVVKGQIDVENSKRKSGGYRGAAALVIAEKDTTFFEACREFTQFGSCVWVCYPIIPGSRISSSVWQVSILPCCLLCRTVYFAEIAVLGVFQTVVQEFRR